MRIRWMEPGAPWLLIGRGHSNCARTKRSDRPRSMVCLSSYSPSCLSVERFACCRGVLCCSLVAACLLLLRGCCVEGSADTVAHNVFCVFDRASSIETAVNRRSGRLSLHVGESRREGHHMPHPHPSALIRDSARCHHSSVLSRLYASPVGRLCRIKYCPRPICGQNAS